MPAGANPLGWGLARQAGDKKLQNQEHIAATKIGPGAVFPTKTAPGTRMWRVPQKSRLIGVLRPNVKDQGREAGLPAKRPSEMER